MSSYGNPLYRMDIVPASAAALAGTAGQRRLMAFLLYTAAADGTVEFKDAATDTTPVVLTVSAIAKTSMFVDFSDIGGIRFNIGLFVKPAGSGVICHVWYD